MPEAVIIANRPFWARISAVFWLIEIVVGLSFAVSGIGFIGAGENGVALVLAICGLMLAGVGVVLAAVSFRIWWLDQPAIEMRETGLIDRRVANQLIPWPAISWKVVFNSRAYSLQFDIEASERLALSIHWEHRLMGRFNRLFKYPEFTMVTLGTGRTAHQLATLVSGFKPQGSPR